MTTGASLRFRRVSPLLKESTFLLTAASRFVRLVWRADVVCTLYCILPRHPFLTRALYSRYRTPLNQPVTVSPLATSSSDLLL
jgi:hypothetical protein